MLSRILDFCNLLSFRCCCCKIHPVTEFRCTAHVRKQSSSQGQPLYSLWLEAYLPQTACPPAAVWWNPMWISSFQLIAPLQQQPSEGLKSVMKGTFVSLKYTWLSSYFNTGFTSTPSWHVSGCTSCSRCALWLLWATALSFRASLMPFSWASIAFSKSSSLLWRLIATFSTLFSLFNFGYASQRL